MPKENYFSKDHPYTKIVEEKMRTVFCKGIIETDHEDIVKATLFFIPINILLLPLKIVYQIPMVIFYLILWVILKNLVQLDNFNVLFFIFSVCMIMHEEIIITLTDVLKATFILGTLGFGLKWICKGYLENHPFRQGFIENPSNSNLITALTATMDPKHRGQYDTLLKLFLKSNTPDGEYTLKSYLEQLERG